MVSPEFLTGVRYLTWAFMFALAVVWLLLPFAMFGVKKRLDKLISLQEKTIQILSSKKG